MGRDSEFSDPAVKTVLKCNCRVNLRSGSIFLFFRFENNRTAKIGPDLRLLQGWP